MTTDVDLASLELFTNWDEAELWRLSAALAAEEHQAGDVLMRQGEPSTSFLILLDGVVTVSRHDRSSSHTMGTAGRGSILGELALLSRGRRHATVRAETSVRAAVGDEDAFKLLLEAPGMHQRLTDIAAQHFATVSDPVAVTVPEGTRFLVTPLLRTDRDELASAFARQSQESMRRRFFTSVRPRSQIIDYLVNIDYIDHIAWGGRGTGAHGGWYVKLFVVELHSLQFAGDHCGGSCCQGGSSLRLPAGSCPPPPCPIVLSSTSKYDSTR